MWLTMSRWILGRHATRPLRRILRWPVGAGGGECRVPSFAKAMEGGSSFARSAMEEGFSFGRVAACGSESVIGNRFSGSWFEFVFIGFSLFGGLELQAPSPRDLRLFTI